MIITYPGKYRIRKLLLVYWIMKKPKSLHLLLSPLHIILLENGSSVSLCTSQYEAKIFVHLAWVLVVVELMILNLYLYLYFLFTWAEGYWIHVRYHYPQNLKL